MGSLTINPTFDGNVTAYTAATTNATNTLSYTTESENASVTIKLGGVVQESATMTWASGDNVLAIEVVDGELSKTYTITVTKS